MLCLHNNRRQQAMTLRALVSNAMVAPWESRVEGGGSRAESRGIGRIGRIGPIKLGVSLNPRPSNPRPSTARSLPLPDQGPVHSDSLKAEGLVQPDGGQVEVVDEKRHGLPFSEEMAADLAQQLTAISSSAAMRVRPDTHQLHGVAGHCRVLA